jgi:hypothetical protein
VAQTPMLHRSETTPITRIHLNPPTCILSANCPGIPVSSEHIYTAPLSTHYIPSPGGTMYLPGSATTSSEPGLPSAPAAPAVAAAGSPSDPARHPLDVSAPLLHICQMAPPCGPFRPPHPCCIHCSLGKPVIRALYTTYVILHLRCRHRVMSDVVTGLCPMSSQGYVRCRHRVYPGLPRPGPADRPDR